MFRFDNTQPAHIDFRGIAKERTETIVAWVGAGLSAPAGLPTWESLKESLVSAIRKKADSRENEFKRKLLDQANQAQKNADPWSAFSSIKQALGETSFAAEVRRVLSGNAKATIPDAYIDLWRIGVSGVLSFNLDGFASRARNSVYPGQDMSVFTGCRINSRVLRSNRPFVAQLHGEIDDTDSWVFTSSDIRQLLKRSQYIEFVRSILLNRTVLFIGISARNKAVERHLRFIQSLGLKTDAHFWLTQYNDIDTDRWAEKVGIRTICYDSSGGDHRGVSEFLKDILEHVPVDEAPEPVAFRGFGETESEEDLPIESEKLLVLNAEEKRQVLNKKAKEMLSRGSQEAYAEYADFIDNNEEVIHQAWFASTKEGSNVLLGYCLEEEVDHKGAFGKVFRATTREGKTVAVKLLHQDIVRQQERLQSFRRGISSMRILTENKVEGMIELHDAAEIPAIAVMNWVEGPNIRQAVECGFIDDWNTFLWIARELCTTIRRAHRLPQRVLHRDIRPPNIMIRHGWEDKEDWEVVVLDFDLSWHRDSFEMSIANTEAINGYLAPEQMQRMKGVSTRSAAVDSFGLGMTLYFMLSKKNPMPNEHAMQGWDKSIRDACGGFERSRWRCLKKRVARILIKATKDKQEERCDMAFMERGLEKLYHLERDGIEEMDVAVCAEEIAARVDDGYSWNSDKDEAEIRHRHGFKTVVRPNLVSEKIEGEIVWDDDAPREYESIRKYLPRRMDEAAKKLDNAGWKTKTMKGGNYQTRIEISCDFSHEEEDIGNLAGGIAAARASFQKL